MTDGPIDECVRVALLGRGARTRAETDRLAHDAAINPKSLSARDVEDLGLAYFRATRTLAGTDDGPEETPETLDGMTIHEWRDTAQGALKRISSAERQAGLTQRQHMREWLPEVKDRALHPYPRPKVYDRTAVLGVFLQIEAEISEEAAP